MVLTFGTLAGEVQTDTERIARGLRKRDVALLHGLIDQYQYRLLRYLLHLLGRREHVEDLMQETWLRVLERGSQYDGHSRFEPWFFAIARNLAFDHLRKRQAFSLDSNEHDDQDEAYDPQSESASPFDEAARSEDAERLAGCLTSLDPIYREVLVLRFQEDLSLSEIAGVIQAPVSTVSSRIYRGLATLRGHLKRGQNAN